MLITVNVKNQLFEQGIANTVPASTRSPTRTTWVTHGLVLKIYNSPFTSVISFIDDNTIEDKLIIFLFQKCV